jgi:hypothetical protein
MLLCFSVHSVRKTKAVKSNWHVLEKKSVGRSSWKESQSASQVATEQTRSEGRVATTAVLCDFELRFRLQWDRSLFKLRDQSYDYALQRINVQHYVSFT